MVVDADAFARVKAFLDRTACVEGHFILRFGTTGITIADLRAVVELVDRANEIQASDDQKIEALSGALLSAALKERV